MKLNLVKDNPAIDAGKLDAGKPLDPAAMLAAGVVSKLRDGVRILAKGELTSKKVEIHAVGASKAAIAAVEKSGGKIVVSLPVPEKLG
jgi:large subunit ribosomal protein L15